METSMTSPSPVRPARTSAAQIAIAAYAPEAMSATGARATGAPPPGTGRQMPRSRTRTPSSRPSAIVASGTSAGGALEDVDAARGPEADDVRHPDPRVLELSVAGLAAELRHHLVDVGDPGGADRVPL